MTKGEDKEEETVALKNCYVRISGQDFAIKADSIEDNGEKTVIYWTTKDGKAKKTTVLTTEILQIDEDV